MKKILYYSETSEFGGAEVALIQLVANIDKTKYEPVCIFRLSRHREKIERELPGVKKYFVSVLTSYFSILYILFKEKPDIVHLNMHVPFSSYFITLAALLLKVPRLIASVHSTVAPCSRLATVKIIKSLLSKPFIKMIDLYICDSKASRDEFCRNYNVPQNKTKVIYIGIEMSKDPDIDEEWVLEEKRRLGIEETDLVVGTLTRMVRNKGIEYLLEAFAKLLRYSDKIVMLLVGSGDKLSIYREKSKELKINERTIFTGFVEDKGRMLSLMDIFVQPSLAETFGISIAEAMAFSKPVVATAVGGVPELVIDQQTGFLVPPGDPEALCNSIIKLIRDGSMRKNMGIEGKKRIEAEFQTKEMIAAYEYIYSANIRERGIIDKQE